MVFRNPRRSARPQPPKRPVSAQPRFERLELRRMLTGGDSTSTGDDLADIQQAAQLSFDGPDLVGKDGPMARIGYDLVTLFEQQRIQQERHPGVPFTPLNPLLKISGGMVSVDTIANGDPAAYQVQLAGIGMTNIQAAGPMVSGEIPISNLNQLAALSSLRSAHANYGSVTRAGSVNGQGDQALRADVARSSFGVNGSGITVGILSDTFNAVPYPGNVDGVARDISTGDLPQDTKVLADLPSGTDEGRAMGQLVHDVAPGAAIRFATAGNSQQQFAQNIKLLANSGSNVIVDDVIFFAEPMFQNGVVAQAVNQVVAQGIPYFSAAGNNGDDSYQSAFVSSGTVGPRGGQLHDFNPGAGVSTLQRISVPALSSVRIVFQWDQPFGSLGGAGSTSDLDIAILGTDGTTVLDSGVDSNIGGDPFEIVTADNLTGNAVTYFFRIELVTGPAPTILKYVMFSDGPPASILDFNTASSTDYGHANAEGAIGVAAAAYFFTPQFGTTPPSLNTFSSKGGTPLVFGPNGIRLANPVLTGSPQVTGVDGANTTFFGVDIPVDADAFPNFFGTSAAAPHVAAVAALMLQSAGGPGTVTPSTILDVLEQTSIDVISRQDFGIPTLIPIPNGTGVDAYSGTGLVNAQNALAALQNRVTINDVTLLEGDSGFTAFVFSITFVGDATLPVTVQYNTLDITATSPGDYLPQSGTFTFSTSGSQTQFVTVPVVGDTLVEGDETFVLALSNVTNSFLGKSQGIGTILNDDIHISIGDLTVFELDNGIGSAVVPVTVEGVRRSPITMSFSTLDGTARAGYDYQPRSGVLTIPTQATSVFITVPIIYDTLNESTEDFFVQLSDASVGTLIKSIGDVTILDNDLPPTLVINDVHVTTTQAGVIAAVFTVALDKVSGQDVTVTYATIDGSAKANERYVGMTGTLSFAPGVNTQLLTIPVLGTGVYAPNEKFFVQLSNESHATLTDSLGVCTIIYADPPPVERILDDGDVGYSQSAGWTNTTNLNAYQLDYNYHAAGNGSGNATWNFARVTPGSYQVFARWSSFSNRATNATYTILDGTTPVGTAVVNQRLAPAGEQSNGITWQSLGTFYSSSGALAVRLSDNANGYVTADAIRIVAGSIPPQVPEMDVASGDVSIADGDSDPSQADGTEFGTVAALTNSVVHTFTITNTGNADLHLLGNPRVEINGLNPQDFVVVTQPAATIGPGSSSSFQIMFHPTATGLRQAIVSISSNEGSEQPYNFEIEGTGGEPGSGPPAANSTIHNASMPLDVNGDSKVSTIDVLLVINNLLAQTSVVPAATSIVSAAATAAPASAKPGYFWDVNGDGVVSPRDALMVINYLNRASTVIAAPAAATPAALALNVTTVEQPSAAATTPSASNSSANVVASPSSATVAPAATTAPVILQPETVDTVFASEEEDDELELELV